MAKSLETKIADLIRMLGTDSEAEAMNAWRLLGRLLASNNASFTDLGNAVEKLATGGLEEAAMQRVFDAGDAQGYARGVAEIRREHAQAQAVFGLHPNGSPNWEAMALYCQREKARLKPGCHEFVDKMASNMAWGREPTEGQGRFILSLFREIGGRLS
jgi:hypothetical protein